MLREQVLKKYPEHKIVPQIPQAGAGRLGLLSAAALNLHLTYFPQASGLLFFFLTTTPLTPILCAPPASMETHKRQGPPFSQACDLLAVTMYRNSRGNVCICVSYTLEYNKKEKQ